MAKLFFSYSHKDETLRNELEIHLSLLKRQGIISSWHDRRITPGNEWAKAIDTNLEEADIILLLVSPDFIASDYCYEIEMTRALERHEQKTTRVIPVILRPCHWTKAPFGKLQAVPTDGKPVVKFPNQDDAFLEITKAIEKVAEEINFLNQPQPSPVKSYGGTRQLSSIEDKPRSSNLRIRKTFSEQEKDNFFENSFEYIANFFENSLAELESRNPGVNSTFKRLDAHHFSVIIYLNGKLAAQCRIWQSSRSTWSNGIAYSSNASGNDNSYNESLSVVDDGYALFLKPLGFHSYGRTDEKLSQQGAAEYLWARLIQPLQQ